MIWTDLLSLLYTLYRAAFARKQTRAELRVWAEGRYEIVSIKLERAPQRMAAGGLTDVASRFGPFLFYSIEVIDSEHVLRQGLARVNHRVGLLGSRAQPVEVEWVGAVQLNWMDCAPRDVPTASDGSAQGWCADPLGLHEQRWFSAGKPTSLVKDGATESSDPVETPEDR